MINTEILMHMAYGRYAGEDKTCGIKQPHASEGAAVKAANSLNNSGRARHEVEAYPCYWCSSDRLSAMVTLDDIDLSWHIGRKMNDKEREVFTTYGFIDMEEIAAPGSLMVHNRLLCSASFCCIHNPSDHHMKVFPLNWRADRGMMERICPHGIGHPDPDDLDFKISVGIPEDGIHRCDGCCSKSYYYTQAPGYTYSDYLEGK